jgi:purine-nucleoside phosphorylase
MDLYDRLTEAAEFIKIRRSLVPRVGVVLGSGLGEFAEAVAEPTVIPYAEIPRFRSAGVVGHAGRLVLGKVGPADVAVLQGRIHHYEGHDIAEVVFPLRVLARLGIQSALLTNAAGGISRAFRPGDLMIIRDHINLMGVNPLRGPNEARLGPRFPDMSAAWDPAYQETIAAALAEIGRPPLRGVYVGLAGPSYETPAEIRMCALLGADAVGMSTVPEAIAARHLGLRLAGISCITNLAAGISDRPLDHQEVTETGRRIKDDFIRLLKLVVPRLV